MCRSRRQSGRTAEHVNLPKAEILNSSQYETHSSMWENGSFFVSSHPEGTRSCLRVTMRVSSCDRFRVVLVQAIQLYAQAHALS
jgi:hypothetical protein